MRKCIAVLAGLVLGSMASQVMAQTPVLSSIQTPYPALQSSAKIYIGGHTYGSGAVSYGPHGTPLILSGANFGTEGIVEFVGYKNGNVDPNTTVEATVTNWDPSILMLTVPSGAVTGLVFVVSGGRTSNPQPFIVMNSAPYAASCGQFPPSSQLQITTSSLPNGMVGQSYGATLSAEGGAPPYTWTITGGNTLPSGLSLAAGTGAISGSPTAVAGPFDITANVTDKNGQTTDAVLSITVDSQLSPSGTIYSYTVPSTGGFDSTGDITQYQDSVQGTWSFGYDDLNRLSSAIPGTGAQSAYQGQNLCFNYDSFGNRTQANFQTAACSPSNPATASYTSANRMNGLSYDAAGDVTYDGTNYYSYDGEGRVCAMQTSSTVGTLAYGYIYDAEGRRIARGTIHASAWGQQPSCNLSTNGFTVVDSYVLGQGGETLTMLDGSGNLERTNVYGAGQLLATYDMTGPLAITPPATTAAPTPALHFHLTDPLGTRRVQTNAQGVAEEVCQNLPFGDSQICSGVDATPLHFTGKERDPESGNDYFGARYYASSMGRFMSPDPSGLYFADPRDPQSLNLYGYVMNNPLSFTDPTGLDCVYISDQTSDSVTVQTKMGDCFSDDDDGIYVNGTIDTSSYSYNGNSINYSYSPDSDDGNSGTFTLGQGTINLGSPEDIGTQSNSLSNDVPLNSFATAVFHQVAQDTAGFPDVCSVSGNVRGQVPGTPIKAGVALGGNGKWSFSASWKQMGGNGFPEAGLTGRVNADSAAVAYQIAIPIPDTPFKATFGANPFGRNSYGLSSDLGKGFSAGVSATFGTIGDPTCGH